MMSIDFALKQTSSGAYDLDFDVEFTDTLDTAIYMSLFCDALADESEVKERPERRGWWGSLTLHFNNEVGSKLWLYDQARLGPAEVAAIARTAETCLQWMVEDGVCNTIKVSTVVEPETGTLFIIIKIDNVTYRIPFTFTRPEPTQDAETIILYPLVDADGASVVDNVGASLVQTSAPE